MLGFSGVASVLFNFTTNGLQRCPTSVLELRRSGDGVFKFISYLRSLLKEDRVSLWLLGVAASSASLTLEFLGIFFAVVVLLTFVEALLVSLPVGSPLKLSSWFSAESKDCVLCFKATDEAGICGLPSVRFNLTTKDLQSFSVSLLIFRSGDGVKGLLSYEVDSLTFEPLLRAKSLKLFSSFSSSFIFLFLFLLSLSCLVCFPSVPFDEDAAAAELLGLSKMSLSEFESLPLSVSI